MVQIHSPRPTLSRTRKLWFFVCSAVDDSVDSRILEVHRARVLASLVRSSFKLGDAGSISVAPPVPLAKFVRCTSAVLRRGREWRALDLVEL